MKCEHGEFTPREGCPQCIADRMGEEGNTKESVAEAVKETKRTADVPPELIKVKQGTGYAPPSLSSTTANDAEPEPLIALALRPGEDIEARGYHKEALGLLKYAKARNIVNFEDMKPANEDLSAISKLKKAMSDKRKSLLDPLKLQADAIRDTYDFLMAPVLEADKITRDKMLGYSAEVTRRRLKEEEINRKRQEAAEEEMRLKGELSESVNLVEVEPEAPKTVRTEMGATTQTDCWKYEVIDFALLSDAHKVEDGPQLTAIARSHHDKKQIPGVRFYNEPIIAVRAR